MTSFGLVCEGATDQKVISNILDGFFGQEIDIVPLMPLRDETDQHRVENYSNWLKVIEYCDPIRIGEALQHNKEPHCRSAKSQPCVVFR